jgi:hypothetical protein
VGVIVGAGVAVGRSVGVLDGSDVTLGSSVGEGNGGMLVEMTGAAQAVIAATSNRAKPMIRDRKLLHMFPSSETYRVTAYLL